MRQAQQRSVIHRAACESIGISVTDECDYRVLCLSGADRYGQVVDLERVLH